MTGDVPAAQAAAAEVFFASSGLDFMGFDTVVCVPTFKRPDLLRRTLRSLAVQTGGRRFACLVVENACAERAGAKAAAEVFGSGALQGAVILEPRQGNCKAYNAGWRFALERFPAAAFVLGLDDDEEAAPDWLDRLVGAAERSGADVVGGPVRTVFADPEGERYRAHPIFSPHYARSGAVPILFASNNYLVRRRVLDRMPRPFLDERFDYLGGGDADFFSRCRVAGFDFYWEAGAEVSETAPARRTELGWMTARGVRNGIISTLIARKADPSVKGRLAVLAKSALLLGAAPARSAALWAKTGSPVIGMYHLNVAVGRFLAEIGVTVEQYRAPEQN